MEARDYIAMNARVLKAAGRRVGEGDVGALRDLVLLRQQLDDAILQAVAGLRDSGFTWQEIGDELGTTRQAAIMRWSRKVDELDQ